MRAPSFYAYLTTYRPEISCAGHVDGDPVTDLARDLGGDPDAPLDDGELYAYLKEKLSEGHEDVLNEAWGAYHRTVPR